MMLDMTPDNRHRIAFLTGMIFHPYVVSVVTLLIVLQELEPLRAVAWVALLAAILLIPVMILLQIARRQEKYAWQRLTRTNIYLAVLLSVLICIGIIIAVDGPPRLLACFVALLIWLPLQFAINTYYTKISIHAAITAGCGTALLMLGVLDTWALKLLVLVIILATGWARHKTRNHTFQQISLGWLAAAIAVLIAFPLVL